jgi:hypothetical protein
VTAPGLVLIAAAVIGLGVSSDAGGRSAGWVAAALLLAAALWVAAGPVLVADADGLTVRGLLRRRRVPWSAVQAIRVDSRRRARAVEIETVDLLLAVPATLLGRTTPTTVAAELCRARDQALGRPGPAGGVR